MINRITYTDIPFELEFNKDKQATGTQTFTDEGLDRILDNPDTTAADLQALLDDPNTELTADQRQKVENAIDNLQS